MTSARKTDLRVDWAGVDAARFACKRWHYSGCLPAGKLVKIGAWEDGRFIGVVIFGRGASPFLLRKYELQQSEGCELVRVALRDHAAPVTRIVALAIRFLRKSNPGLRLIVSFADPMQGHHGGIYQAGNWVYTGTSGETTEVYVRGKWTHMRGAFHQMTESSPTRICPGKHRYLMPLDDAIRAKVEPMRQPYPGRARGVASGAAEA
jgi:hypothetical protein